MVSSQFYYTISVRSYFIFATKICRIYTACGVSQTPISAKKERKVVCKQEKVSVGGWMCGRCGTKCDKVKAVSRIFAVIC